MLDAPKQITDLIERFERNMESYHSQTYNETQLRREFIDPFFDALGWDVTNKAGYAEAYKDVIHEDAIRIGSATKAPDYCFRIGGVRKFFLEAKKPSVGIKDDVSPAYQLRRYAWSAKLPLSILTDFEEFAVYDCRFLPKPDDKSSTSRILYLTYQDYASRWEEIASVFSKEAVLQGSFDKFAISAKGKRGTSEVDAEFLTEIEGWRDSLARNLALRNPNLTVRDLNFAVQRTIDRIIFLRMCEDRGVEPYGQLQALLNGENIYERLRYIYGLADDRYNSGLFHFKPEKGRAEAPDELTLTLTIDDKALKDIIRRLYYPESPYEFSVLSADILGNVYEQFLGKVIRLTTGHRAVVEEKPEVKKAGGVYYTPAYIVDYIVKNTVGKLCEGKTPKQIAKFRILDPACGSGSFLIGAYAYLLDYHRNWYVDNDPKKHTKEIYQGAGGQWLLTTQEKKRILLKNIYGVDIDSQAVEVTKLSLLLKVLEGENKDTLERQFKMWRERALPDLGSNIKCGNSLIGPDFYQNHQMNFLDDEERYRINVFDWETEFPKIMKEGGFDAVMGNPPYGALFLQEIRHFLAKKYAVSIPITDSFVLFMLKSLQILKENGIQSFIIPSTWLYMPSYLDFRKMVLSTTIIANIVLFRKPVFQKATVETCIEVTHKKKANQNLISFQEILNDPASLEGNKSSIGQRMILEQPESNLYPEAYGTGQGLYLRMNTQYSKLKNLSTIVCGLTPYRKGKGKPKQTQKIVDSRAFDAGYKVNKTYRQYIMGRDFQRYAWQIGKKRWISYGDWLAEPRYKAPFNDPLKVVIRQTADKIIAHIDQYQFLSFKNVHNLQINSENLTYPYLLGLLNSKLISWWYQCLIPERGRVFAEVKVVNLEKLPIRTINFDDPKEKNTHDRLVKLVEQMLELHKRLKDARTPDDKTRLQRQIDATDGQIDQLVYELYGLTEEEIKIVEGATT